MLDFQKRSKLPNYLGSKLQRRLLLYLATAVVLALLAAWAANSRRYGEPDPAVSDAHLTAQVGGSVGPQSVVPEDDDEDARPLFPGVREDYLRDVRDDTVFRGAEKDAWFHLLDLLKNTDPAELEAASEGHVGYLQLDQQASSYRGHLVTISGIVRSAKQVTAPENAFGIDSYYQLWLQPDRSAPELVVVYCLELPEGFPLGAELDAECTTTGFFFKRWAYQAQSDILTAPLLLARTIDWQPPPPPPAESPAEEDVPLEAFAAALLVALVLLALFALRSRSSRRRSEPPADASSKLAALERDFEPEPVRDPQEPAP